MATLGQVNRRRQKLKQQARRLDQRRGRDANRREREERRQAFLARVAEGERRGCLFCRRSDGGFTTVEHTLSESLGNRDVTLENGVVCDRCNNGVLSDLDQTLAEFWPLKVQRTFFGVPSKSGKLPVARFQKGTVTNKGRDPDTGQDRLFFAMDSAKDKESFRTTPLGGGRVHVNLQLKGGRPLTPRYASELSRALLKVCFECAWIDHGEAMLGPEFDHVRDAVLGAPRDGYLILLRRGQPNDTGLELTYRPVPAPSGGQMLVVAARFYGFRLATDSMNPAPAIPLPEDEAVVVTFTKRDTSRRGR